MKKKDIIDLIKYHVDNDDANFKTIAHQIARDFYDSGDVELANYILAILSKKYTFEPQNYEYNFNFLDKINVSNENLILPNVILDDIKGIINSILNNNDLNKFLFEGFPGTGKTESIKHIARITEREIYSVNFNSLIDSRLGQTQKNINEMFNELNHYPNPKRIIVLFDEIDAIALDRVNSHDLREMGRSTTAFLMGLDNLNPNITIFATTNMFGYFDKALIRRFDYVVNFDRYTNEDLYDVASHYISEYSQKYQLKLNNELLKKIILNVDNKIMPGELKNLIKTSIAFSNSSKDFDYLSKLYKNLYKDNLDLQYLKQKGFTVREIEILTGISKSQVSRMTRGVIYE